MWWVMTQFFCETEFLIISLGFHPLALADLGSSEEDENADNDKVQKDAARKFLVKEGVQSHRWSSWDLPGWCSWKPCWKDRVFSSWQSRCSSSSLSALHTIHTVRLCIKTHVLTNICPLLLTGRVALLSGNLTASYMRVMTACRAGWHNSETPDREVTISRGFPFCFKCVWPLPQQLNVSKCSFWNLLLFNSPHFYINPESEGLTNLKVSQERPRKQPILVCQWLDPLMSFALSLHNHTV